MVESFGDDLSSTSELSTSRRFASKRLRPARMSSMSCSVCASTRSSSRRTSTRARPVRRVCHGLSNPQTVFSTVFQRRIRSFSPGASILVTRMVARLPLEKGGGAGEQEIGGRRSADLRVRRARLSRTRSPSTWPTACAPATPAVTVTAAAALLMRAAADGGALSWAALVEATSGATRRWRPALERRARPRGRRRPGGGVTLGGARREATEHPLPEVAGLLASPGARAGASSGRHHSEPVASVPKASRLRVLRVGARTNADFGVIKTEDRWCSCAGVGSGEVAGRWRRTRRRLS